MRFVYNCSQCLYTLLAHGIWCAAERECDSVVSFKRLKMGGHPTVLEGQAPLLFQQRTYFPIRENLDTIPLPPISADVTVRVSLFQENGL